MAIILLRVMTKKSIIGFGAYKNTSVQNLLDQRNYAGLISIYYNLDLVTFCSDVLEELNLVGERAINKPGKSREMGLKYINEISEQLREINGLYKQTDFTEMPMNNYLKRANSFRRAKEKSKMLNKIRVHKGK